MSSTFATGHTHAALPTHIGRFVCRGGTLVRVHVHPCGDYRLFWVDPAGDGDVPVFTEKRDPTLFMVDMIALRQRLVAGDVAELELFVREVRAVYGHESES